MACHQRPGIHHYKLDLLETDSSLFCSIELHDANMSKALVRAGSFVSPGRQVRLFEDGQAVATIRREPSGYWSGLGVAEA